MKHYKKRNSKGRFRKSRNIFRTLKIIAITLLAYKYFEPAIEVVWTHSVAPQLAQLIIK